MSAGPCPYCGADLPGPPPDYGHQLPYDCASCGRHVVVARLARAVVKPPWYCPACGAAPTVDPLPIDGMVRCAECAAWAPVAA